MLQCTITGALASAIHPLLLPSFLLSRHSSPAHLEFLRSECVACPTPLLEDGFCCSFREALRQPRANPD